MNPKQWQRIKELFQQALPLDDVRRKVLLEAKEIDTEVRARVWRMLTAHATADDLFKPPRIDPDMLVAEDEERRMIGRRIGLYTIEKHIGEGGMGHVYLARREDDFNKTVALKIIKRGMDTEALLRRFRQERQILANLTHPNIARLLDGGSTGDGRPYLVMEYIEGTSITEYCDRRRLDIRQRLKLFITVCRAVSHAHQNLVVHRDLKPGNILVSEDGTVKLLDFGIAKIIDTSPGSGGHTMAASRISTPEYASPEQILGRPISTASDIYSLGILLYTLLCGHRPYSFTSRAPAAIEDVITNHRPDPPGSRIVGPGAGQAPEMHGRAASPEKLKRLLRGDLDNITMKALRKEPERRYESVELLSGDISRYLRGLPVSAGRDTALYRMGKFIKRHRMIVGGLALIFITLTLAVAAVSRQAHLARQEALKARQSLAFVKKMLAAADPLEAGKELTVVQLLDKAGERIPLELKNYPEIESEIRSILGEAYQNLGYYDKAAEHLQKNLTLLKKHYGPEHPLTANGYRELAVAEHYRGDYDSAGRLYRISISLYRKKGRTGDGDYATALNDFGTLFLDQARPDSAIVLLRQSLRIALKNYGELHYLNGSILNNLAYAYDDQGDYTRADSAYRRALRIFRHNYGAKHPEIANTLNNQAFVKLNTGDTLASLRLHEQALEMWLKLVDKDHPHIATTLHNIAAVNFYLKNLERAEALERQALAIFYKSHPAGHPYLASAFFMLGRILNARAQYAEALDYHRRALDIRQKKLDKHHPALAGSYLETGISLMGLRQGAEAEKMLRRAQALFDGSANADDKMMKKINRLLSELRQTGDHQ